MLSHEKLLELLEYSPSTGLFTWRVSRSGNKGVGSIAGTLQKDGCLTIGLDRKIYKAHRLAWFYMTGSWPKKLVDHRNTIRTDNSWNNLREANHAQNMYNSPSKNKFGATGIRAVGSKFQVYLTENGYIKYFGTCHTQQEAITLSLQEQRRIHKEFFKS